MFGSLVTGDMINFTFRAINDPKMQVSTCFSSLTQPCSRSYPWLLGVQPTLRLECLMPQKCKSQQIFRSFSLTRPKLGPQVARDTTDFVFGAGFIYSSLIPSIVCILKYLN